MPGPNLTGTFISRLNKLEISYVITRKLEYFRESGSDKHLRDMAGMLELSSDQITKITLYSEFKIIAYIS